MNTNTQLLSIVRRSTLLAITLVTAVAMLLAAYPVLAADSNFADGITVDSTGDGADANVGDGICDDGTGDCTLRAAIEEADFQTGTQTIRFNITGAPDYTIAGQNGYTIQPSTVFPVIDDTVIIDGYTQPGSLANTAPAPEPLNGRLLIQIDGQDQNLSALRLEAGADNSIIRGLVMNRFQGGALYVDGANDTKLQGTYIGTDPTGLIARPNGEDNSSSSTAVTIGDTWLAATTDTATTGTLIGGLAPAERNVVSGNYGGAFGVIGVDTTFYGNYLGLGADGLTTLSNSTGTGVSTGVLTIDYADGVQIGGSASGAANLVSGNERGIQPDYSTGVIIQGNLIGTDYTGTLARPNLKNGISFGLGGAGNLVGGTDPAEGNIIAYNIDHGVEIWSGVTDLTVQNNKIYDNTGHGVLITNSSDNLVQSNTVAGNTIGNVTIIGVAGIAENNVVRGNSIGVSSEVPADFANQGFGVGIIGANNNLIGGTVAADGNVISGNHGAGIVTTGLDVAGNPIMPTENAYLGNSIYDNAAGSLYGQAIPGEGIENTVALLNGSFIPQGIASEGPTPNDAGDTDTGPNNYMNFPVIATADQNQLALTISFDLDAADSPTDQYRMELFANDAADDSGYGEGKTYLGYTTVAPGNSQSATITLPTGTNLTGKVLSATITALDGTTNSGFGSTSEFSLASAITVSALPQSTQNGTGAQGGNLANTGQNVPILTLIGSAVLAGALAQHLRSRRYSYRIRR